MLARSARLIGTAALAALLVLAAAPEASAHDYFVGETKKPNRENKISPGDTLTVAPGDKITILVADGIGCPANLTATIDNTAVATVKPPKANRKVSQKFVVTAGKTPGVATLTITVQGVGSVRIGGGRGGSTVDCDEDSTNVFTICVTGGGKDARKQFGKYLKGQKKAFTKSLKAKLSDLKKEYAATEAKLEKGELTIDDAIREACASRFAAGQKVKQCWFDMLDGGAAEGQRLLQAEGSPPDCGGIHEDFGRGGGGEWDRFNQDLQECVTNWASDVESDFRVLKMRYRSVPASGVNTQPTRTRVDTIFGQPVAPIVDSSPSGTDTSPPDPKPVGDVAVTVVYNPRDQSNSVTIMGTGDPGEGNISVRLRVGGQEFTTTVTAAQGTCVWTHTFTNVGTGSATYRARYEGDRGTGAASFFDVR